MVGHSYGGAVITNAAGGNASVKAGAVDAYVKPSLFPSCFANDLQASTAAVLAATQRPISTAAIPQPSGPPAWVNIPSWALVGTADHVIPPAEQLFMAQRADAHIVKVNASHLSMISHPDAVTRLVVNAARSSG